MTRRRGGSGVRRLGQREREKAAKEGEPDTDPQNSKGVDHVLSHIYVRSSGLPINTFLSGDVYSISPFK